MKKAVLMLAIVAIVSFAFTSCKKDKKEDVKTEESKTEAGEEMAENHLYQCPMNCEEGKSYTEAGACPVCKMALKEKSVDMDGEKEHKDGDADKKEGEHNEGDDKDGA